MLIIYPYWILNLFEHNSEPISNSLIIYPYWILNYKMTLNVNGEEYLIIYPYWILNLELCYKFFKFLCSYNLSILDFK